MSCSQLKGYCKHGSHGAKVRKNCPKTCGSCKSGKKGGKKKTGGKKAGSIITD